MRLLHRTTRGVLHDRTTTGMEPVEKRLDRFRYVRAAELIIDFRRDAFCCAIDHQPIGKGILANFDDINGAVHRG